MLSSVCVCVYACLSVLSLALNAILVLICKLPRKREFVLYFSPFSLGQAQFRLSGSVDSPDGGPRSPSVQTQLMAGHALPRV